MEDSKLETQIPELLLETLECKLSTRKLLYNFKDLNDHERETLYPGRLIEAVTDKVDFKFYQEQQVKREYEKNILKIS